MLNLYLSLIDSDGDKSKFEELYSLYRQDMFKTANNILNNTYDAEDAVHEAFLRVAKNFSKISEINCPQTRAYLIIIVRNICFGVYQKRIKEKYFKDFDEYIDLPDASSLEEDVISRLDKDLIKAAAKKLPLNYYEILLLEQREYKISEIASLLGISSDNAKKRLQRAKMKLKELIETEL